MIYGTEIQFQNKLEIKKRVSQRQLETFKKTGLILLLSSEQKLFMSSEWLGMIQ